MDGYKSTAVQTTLILLFTHCSHFMLDFIYTEITESLIALSQGVHHTSFSSVLMLAH